MSTGAGEKASFHRFVDPGQIPRCYLADTYCNTNSVHGIPHHGFHLAEKNYRSLHLSPTTHSPPVDRQALLWAMC